MPFIRRDHITTASLIFAAVSMASVAPARPPSPSESYVAPHLVSCPAGDSAFVVIARDLSNNPWAECCVNLHICSCLGFHLSTAGANAYIVDPSGCVVSVDLSDGTSLGTALFPLPAGGLCPGDSMRVDGDGVTLGYVKRVASFDQTGDLRVADDDLALVRSKIGTADPTADFDGDGQVTEADLAIAEGHLGHMADDAVGVPPPGVGPLALSRPIPNPFSRETHFTLMLDRALRVAIRVQDLAGRCVATLFDGTLSAGPREFRWNGASDDGGPLPSGVYLLELHAGERRIVRKTIVIRDGRF